MQMALRSALISAFLLSPAAASAQGLVTLAPEETEETLVIQEPAVVEETVVVEEPVIVQAPVVMGVPMAGPLTEDDAVAIAMMNGIVTVEDVDDRFWDGHFEVEGDDASGNDLEITIDGETGAVLEIDD